MESSETRAARLGAERCRDRALEERGLAAGKKNAARLGAHIVFADESGFLLAPLVVRTWAPQGCTPLQHHRQGRRDKISVISGISVSPQRQRLGLYYLLFFDNIGQEEVCVFLRELLRHLRGPVPAKNSVQIEIVAFTEPQSVTFLDHADSTFVPARLFPGSCLSASRDSCSPTSASGLATFEPRS